MSDDGEQVGLDEVVEEYAEKTQDEEGRLQLGPIGLEIPAEWGTGKLNDEFELTTGENYEGDHVHEEPKEDGKLFLSLKSVNKGGGFNWDSIKYYTGDVREENKVEPGDLLIANTDVTQDGDIVGYSVTVPDFDEDREIAVSMDLSILRPKDGVNRKFAEYLLQTDYIHSRMRAFSAGSTVLHLNTDLAEELSIPLPPLPEQLKIASVLYNVDEAIRKTEEIIEGTKRVKKGTIEKLTMRGVGHTEFKEMDITPGFLEPEIPETWETVSYEEVSENITYGFTSPMPEADSGPWMITAKDISGGEIDYDTARKTTKEAFSEKLTGKSRPDPGTVLITKDGTLGRVAIVDRENICINQSVASIEPIQHMVIPEFLALTLRSPLTKKLIEAYNPQTTIGHIKISEMAKWDFGLPPLEEQKEIVSIVDSTQEMLLSEKRYRERLQRIKRALMQDLLTGEVRTKDRDIDVLPEVEAQG